MNHSRIRRKRKKCDLNTVRLFYIVNDEYFVLLPRLGLLESQYKLNLSVSLTRMRNNIDFDLLNVTK